MRFVVVKELSVRSMSRAIARTLSRTREPSVPPKVLSMTLATCPRRALLASALWLAAVSLSSAADWPEWRGPERNGISREKGWLVGWPAGTAPKVAWRAAVGKGHSAVSVSNGRAFSLGSDGTNDTIYCFDAKSGKVEWKSSYPCKTILQWPGPRATPTVHAGQVYALSQHGRLAAHDTKTGALIWTRQLDESYNPDVDYGFAGSPLVEGELLILAVGKRGLALHGMDGSFAWGNDGQHGACVSPVRYEHGGERGVALITTDPGRDSVSLVGVNPQTGDELWRHGGWPEKWGAACVDLLIHEGHVFVTTAEQRIECARFSISGKSLELDWTNRNLSSYTGNCVLVDGHIYGVDKTGILTCLDWKSGATVWKQRGFDGHGTLIASDGKLIVETSRTGELVIVEASPVEYREIRRAKVFEGEPTTFTAPVLANGRIYCRSYEGEIVCLEVGVAE
jgi:outer membrane protein assembly factor BamB